jgi:NTE family protein
MSMAFLSSFKIGPDTVYPESLRQHLRSFHLLEDVSDAALKKLLSEANWFGLPGGMLLKRDGENERAVFLVITGGLGVFAEDERGKRRLVAHIPAGETVGEMSMISGNSEHSAQIVAMRDTELLRVDFTSSARHAESDAHSGEAVGRHNAQHVRHLQAENVRDRAVAAWPRPVADRASSGWRARQYGFQGGRAGLKLRRPVRRMVQQFRNVA